MTRVNAMGDKIVWKGAMSIQHVHMLITVQHE